MNTRKMGAKLSVVVGVAMINIAVAAPGSAQAEKLQGEELLPPNAKPGECYARVFIPPTYKTVSERAVKKEASERIEITPAQYETVTERVLVKGASKKIEVVPATYGWEEETILVKAASTRLVEVPAVYESVAERVIDKPAHTVWKKGNGPIQKVNNATGEIMCLVEVPATYKTLTKKVLKSPATTREMEVPTEYKTIKRRVMTAPPTTREIEIPAEYDTVQVTKVVRPAQEQRIEIPVEYQTVTRTEHVSEGRMEWQSVLCETNASRSTVMSIQRALKTKGFNPGDIDGIIGTSTMNAVRHFQVKNGLPTGQLSTETIKALGVTF